uniref:Integrase catalytic domain-containing protein n=1 Tax=Vitis vinifera TaxID=29760 RepID=A5AJF1_VITVI|nr:hypothetical protein VITISV_025437 [Vitis vinifera]
MGKSSHTPKEAEIELGADSKCAPKGEAENEGTSQVKKNELKCFVVHTALRAIESHSWYLDSGCSHHMTGNKSLFTSFTEFDGGNVTFGDGNMAGVKGKGTICAPNIPNLEEVLYVEGLKANLISISQMCENEFNVQFSQNLCKVFDLNDVCVMIGLRTCDNCYVVSKKSPSSSSLVCGSSKIACVNHLLKHRLLQNEKEHPIVKVRIDRGRKLDDANVVDRLKNHVLHSRSKHVDIKHQFIQDLVEDKIVSLEFFLMEGFCPRIAKGGDCECLARLAIPDKIPKCPLTQLFYSYSDYLTLKTKTLLRGREEAEIELGADSKCAPKGEAENEVMERKTVTAGASLSMSCFANRDSLGSLVAPSGKESYPLNYCEKGLLRSIKYEAALQLQQQQHLIFQAYSPITQTFAGHRSVEFADYQGFQDALLGEKNLPSTMQEKQKIELLEEAHSAIILSLSDTVLREVAKAKSATKLWLKLESLYMTKSLANRLHKKIKLYTFKMTTGMSIEEHLDHFNKIILDLENIDITILDEDKAILLLTSLDASYTNMKEAIMYGRDSLTFDEETKHSQENREWGDAAVILDGYDSAEMLNVAEMDSSKEWILDSGCSFHMCPIKAWFKDFKEADGGYVIQGSNEHYKILGTDTVRIKHYDGIERVLKDVKYIPELKRNLISLGMLDNSGYTFESEPNSLRVARGSLTIMKGTIKNGLYTFIGQIVTGKVSTVPKEDVGTTNLWHQRLGIATHRTVRYTPQQNALAERMNRTILERVRCMLSSSGLSKVFWAETVETTVHLINKSLSSALQLKTPQEKWTGKYADYQYLKVFGCTAYVHTKTNKLESRVVKCIFLGYSKGVKAKDVEESDQLQFDVEHETLQPKKSTETSSKTVQEKIVYERQDEPTQGLESYSLARDRQKRQVKPPKRYGQAEMTTFALSVAEEIVDMEPKTNQEAINSDEANQWVKVIQEKMDSLRKNETWELVTKPKDRKLVGSKWVFKRK